MTLVLRKEGVEGSNPSAGSSFPSTSLRLRLLYAALRLLFVFAFGVLGLRRAVIRDNLARSFPELAPRTRGSLRRQFIRRQSELAAEVVYGARIGADELRQRVLVANPELLESAAAPRPLVIAAAHQGNFEWVLLRLSLTFGEQFLALYKPMRDARVDGWFKQLRSRFGARPVPAKSVLQELARFRDARAIGIVADQVPRTSPEKHWVAFLNQDTAFYMGPELLGRALRSRVVFADMRRLARGRYELRLIPLNEPGERLAPGTITARYAHELERVIREDPPAWWWSHRRWKLQRDAESTSPT